MIHSCPISLSISKQENKFINEKKMYKAKFSNYPLDFTLKFKYNTHNIYFMWNCTYKTHRYSQKQTHNKTSANSACNKNSTNLIEQESKIYKGTMKRHHLQLTKSTYYIKLTLKLLLISTPK